MSEKEGIIMICRKCGCMLESGTRICPFCGEPATLAASPVVEGLPELVLLNELAPVPATREETLKELRRLESYFGELDTKYATLADLWLKSACWQAPSKVRWAVGGFLLALLLYLLVGIHLPAMAVWIFVDNCKCKSNSCFNQEHLSIAWTSSRKWSKSSAGV